MSRSASASTDAPSTSLAENARVGVIGGGPAGSMFSYFFLNNVKRLGMNISVDMYEPKDFTRPGPAGCNMCGGIISESLVQAFASEGIILPPTMIQRGIDSYVLHMDVGTVRIETPLKEKRIGSVHRGGGPRDATELKWCSFDGFLQSLALEKGANLIDKKISRWDFEDDRPRVFLADDSSEVYDLLVVAVGANSPLLKSATDLAPQFKSPKTVRTYIREFQSTEARLSESLGSAMHVFLLDMPELEFAAAIPKGNFVSVCVLCKKDGLNTLNDFMASSVVSNCLASDLTEREGCRCSPKMNLLSDGLTFSDRIVFIGDSGVTRLYKDGIGAAYRTAKAAASTAAFEGVSANDFKRSFWITCREIRTDNKFGTVIFFVSGLFKKFRFTRKIMLRIVTGEQTEVNSKRLLSTVLWDMFTGSAPYKDIFYRTLKPTFLWNLLRNTIRVLFGSAAVQKI